MHALSVVAFYSLLVAAWMQDDMVAGSLAQACRDGDEEAVQRLLDTGADPNEPTHLGWLYPVNPLHAAARNGHLSIMQNLIQAGANVSVPDNLVFDTAVRGHADALRLLFAAGARVDRSSKPPLLALRSADHFGLGEDEMLQVAQVLIEAGADVEARDYSGTPVLHIAVINGHLRIVKFLVEAGASLESVDRINSTPLMDAANFGYLEIAKFLVAAGSNINSKNYRGTPLMMAAKMGYADMVEFLVNSGADMNIAINWGTALAHAAAGNHLAIVKFLVEQGADISIASNSGNYTPLLTAARYGDPHLVEYLLAQGADVHAELEWGDNALHFAVDNDADVFRLLLNAGADVNHLNDKRQSPLSSAMQNCNIRIVEMLLAAGADVNSADENGDTPLTLALFRGDENCASLLRHAGGIVPCNSDTAKEWSHAREGWDALGCQVPELDKDDDTFVDGYDDTYVNDDD